MSRRSVPPVVVTPGGAAQALERLAPKHGRFHERELQELLADHPELLPVGQMRNDAGALLCLGREVKVPAGSIDLLCLSTQGYPVVVETKLWRSPQSRREVLAQALEYVKDLVVKDYGWFEAEWMRWQKARRMSAIGLVEALGALTDEELDETFIVDRLHRALARGDVLAVIVGDGITTRLQDLVEHLCRGTPHLRYSIALVELACYPLDGEPDGRMVVVPRLVDEIEPAQRAYVRIEVAEDLKHALTVTPAVEPAGKTAIRRRPSLAEDEFYDAVEDAAGRPLRIAMELFAKDLADAFGLEEEFKAAALMLKIPHPDGESNGASVLALEKQGRIYNTWHLPKQLAGWGFTTAQAKRIATDYWSSLHAVDNRFRRDGILHLRRSQFLPFADVQAKLPAIRACVEDVVGVVREEIGSV